MRRKEKPRTFYTVEFVKRKIFTDYFSVVISRKIPGGDSFLDTVVKLEIKRYPFNDYCSAVLFAREFTETYL